MNSKIHRKPKCKKVNKFWRKSFDQHKVELKNKVCLREKEEYNYNVLRNNVLC